jgi:DNA invertase Pin-like site-specific DNA recombinase
LPRPAQPTAVAPAVAYGYLRVSSDAQVASGLGLDAQLQRILAEQDRLRAGGLTIGHVYRDEAVSALRHAMRDRPAGSALDTAIRAGDHVCIAMLDRAFRTQRDAATTLEAWLSRGVTVHLLDVGADTSTPVGQLTVGILAAVAQWESQRLGERIRDAKAAQRRAGRSTNGRARLGYRLGPGGQLRPDARQRRIHRSIALLRTRGWRLCEIAEQLNRTWRPRPGTRRWNGQAVARALVARRSGYP